MTWHEADLVVETLADAVEASAERPRPVLIAGGCASRHIAAAPGDGRLWREGLRGVAVDAQKSKPEVCIDATDAVEMASALFLVEEDDADVRVGQDVAAQSNRAEVGRRYPTLFALLDVQEAERIPALAAGHARTRQDGNRRGIVGQADPTAEKQPHLLRGVLARHRAAAPAAAEAAEAAAKLKDAGVLEKEVTLFRKEQTESRKVDLLLVRFHL